MRSVIEFSGAKPPFKMGNLGGIVTADAIRKLTTTFMKFKRPTSG
jgi:hypothetical protein